MDEKIRTHRLLLRCPELSDGPALAEHFQDYDVVKMTGTIPHPFVPMAADFWILRTRARQRRDLARSYMIETHSRMVIGNISLFRSETRDDFEIGYHIGRLWWGQGYATEACRAVLETAKADGQQRIVAGVYDDNPASQRMLEKFGFRQGEPDEIYCMARQCVVRGHRYALELNRAASAV